MLDSAEMIQKMSWITIESFIWGQDHSFGLAHEAQLKILELTAGRVATMYESPVGFPPYPKSLVNKETVISVNLDRLIYQII